MNTSTLNLYNKYFLDRNFERLGLFRLLADTYGVLRALYAGSFVHITPSFVFPDVVYVDSDKQAKRFFDAPEAYDYIDERKVYPQTAQARFYFQDYRTPFDEPPESFDLLISQYAGFVGQACKAYLKHCGLLLTNNSHGDAGLAAIDPDYQLIAVFFSRNDSWRMSSSDLDAYFVPKTDIEVTRPYLEKLGKGLGYKKTANAYLFRRK